MFKAFSIIVCVSVPAGIAAQAETAIKPDRLPIVLPPYEYNYPFTGKLTITRFNSQAEIRANCPLRNLTVLLACAESRTDKSRCHIKLVQDEVIINAGWTYKLVMRHELGHCNGWAPDHAGARYYLTKEEAEREAEREEDIRMNGLPQEEIDKLNDYKSLPGPGR